MFSNALNSGNCLVHCHHGADRTGAMIARWEIENGQKKPQDAYESALSYGFKDKDFNYPGQKKDPNKYLREYIFESEQKMEKDEGILDSAISFGKEKIVDLFGLEENDDFSNLPEYDDEKGKTPIDSRLIYNYLITEKGLSHNHAIGMIANMIRESALKPGVSGDYIKGKGYTSSGLFQMHGIRQRALINDVPDWKINWKGQIDHALKTDKGPEYISKEFDSPFDAIKWFEKKYERPNPKHYKDKSWYSKKLKDKGFLI